MATHEAGTADRLNQLLDAQSSNGPAWRQHEAPDEWEFAATADQVRTLDDAPRADPRFAQHLLQTLLAETPMEDRTMMTFALTYPHASTQPMVLASPSSRMPPSPRWNAAALATAVLALLAVAVSLAFLPPNQTAEPSVAPVILPALSGTPETTAATAATPAARTPGTSLLHLVMPESSGDRAFVSLERYTLPPSAAMELDLQVGNTPLVAYLVAGEVQAHLGDASPAARVVRTGGTGPEAVLDGGAPATLAAGDALVVPEHGAARITNETTAMAEVLLLFQPTGVPAVLSTAGEFATMGTQVHPIQGELTLDLRQVTLSAGSAIVPSEDPQVVQIAGALDPDRVMDVRTASGGALRNAGEEPLEVYVLTVASSGSLR